ncbi:YesL family protein [Lacticaseibacillus jixiensis]|uniref:YesL family protein n=1 Tax=Lacticaseibacillus jixiensis TaxID=3231926 RepID=UPI0036F3B39C
MKYSSNSDSLFTHVGSKLANLTILNLIYLLTCLPIVTIGVSTTALFKVTFSMVNEHQDTKLVRTYFKAWKDNFGRGLSLGLIQLWLLILLLVLLQIQQALSALSFVIGGIVVLGAAILYGILFVYVYGYSARYHDKLWHSIKACVVMGVIKWRQTAVLLITVISCLLVLPSTAWLLALGMMVFVLFGFALLAYLAVPVQMAVFTAFEPHSQHPNESAVTESGEASDDEARLAGK